MEYEPLTGEEIEEALKVDGGEQKFTQAQLDYLIKKRFARVKPTSDVNEAKLTKLTEDYNNLLDAYSKAEPQLKELEQLRLSKVQTEVAAEHNIPMLLADRLRGSTREEMVEDAKKLMLNLGAKMPLVEDTKGVPAEDPYESAGALFRQNKVKSLD